MLKFATLMVTVILQNVKCSLVIDRTNQKGIYLSEYCPTTKNCPEGSHVMCMYYNPDHVMGPRCLRPKNVSITPDLAEKLLEVSNAIRSKIALGKEKGKRGESLPRGYGMFRLKWDNELATFAQVLANQCVLRHDMCRASKRFSNPGQTAGLVRFTYPDWFPVSNSAHFTKPGLTASKLSFATTTSLKSWYAQKNGVSPGMISKYPDWTYMRLLLNICLLNGVKLIGCGVSGPGTLGKKNFRNPTNLMGRLYLEMIYGPTTHMGCGISAYAEYAYYDSKTAKNYNSVQIICNYSSRPKKGEQVYRIEPPTDMGYSERCGCPLGTEEDADCLCHETQKSDITAPSGRTCSSNGDCKPAVVLLPIFTVENAPPEKLIGRSGFDMSSLYDKKDADIEIADMFPSDNSSVVHAIDNSQNNIQSILGSIINDGYSRNERLSSLHKKSSIMESPVPKNYVKLGYGNFHVKEPQSVISSLVNEAKREVDPKAAPHSKPLIHDVKKRVFGKHPNTKLRYHNSNTVRSNWHQARKESVFTKAAKFVLPKEGGSIKMDVQPRKDFSNVKNLVQDYLQFKNGKKDSRLIFSPHEHNYEHLNHKTTTEIFLNSAEEKVMNYNYYLNNISHPVHKSLKNLGYDTNSSTEMSSNKLMKLLNKLEQEVKHIDLDRNKKEIFDAKIRKIYGKVVGEPGLLTYKTSIETDFTDTELTDFAKYEPDHNRYSDFEGKNHVKTLHHKSDFEELEKNVEHVRDKYSDFENEIRPITRNTVYGDKLTHLNPRSLKTSKGYESESKHSYNDIGNLKLNMRKAMYSTDNDIKSDHGYSDKELLRTRSLYSNTEDKKHSKYPDTRKFHDDDDPLSLDRRTYYASKLDNLEKKLHSARNFKHHKDNSNREMRPVLPTREEQPLRPSKSQPDTFYMPERARFLHGF